MARSKTYFNGVLCEKCIHYGGRVGHWSERQLLCKGKPVIIHVNLCENYKEKKPEEPEGDGTDCHAALAMTEGTDCHAALAMTMRLPQPNGFAMTERADCHVAKLLAMTEGLMT